MKTEQRSLRLSKYYLAIVENLQEKNGLSFTDAIKHIITEYAKTQNNENDTNRILQNLEKSLKNIKPSALTDPIFNGQDILDELNKIGGNIHLLLKAVAIIGVSNSRTVIEIEDLLGEDEQ